MAPRQSPHRTGARAQDAKKVRPVHPPAAGGSDASTEDRARERDEIVITGPAVAAYLRRLFLEAVLIGVILGAAAYMVSIWAVPAQYQAQSFLVVPSAAQSGQSLASAADAVSPLPLNAYRAAAISDGVLVPALHALGVTSPTAVQVDELRRRLSVHPSIQENVATDVLVVDATASSASGAVRTANAVAASVVAWDKARANQVVTQTVASLSKQAQSLNAQLATLQKNGATTAQLNSVAAAQDDVEGRLARARALQDAAGSPVAVIAEASTPTAPSFPRPMLFAGVAFIVGLVLTYLVGLFVPAGKRSS